MVTCEEFYEKFSRVGNFCQKSENTARQIDEYIAYRKKHKLGSYEINRCALYPMIVIEKNDVLHQKCLKELRATAKKIGGRKITRRHVLEIINRVNNEVEEGYRIVHIPGIRSRMNLFQHEIGNVGYDVREAFDKLKNEIGMKSNNDLMTAMINFCSNHRSEVEKIRDMMNAAKPESKDNNMRIVSEV